MKVKELVHLINNKTNLIVVEKVVDILTSYGYITGNVGVEHRQSVHNGCKTSIIDGDNTRYVIVETDIRELADKEKYVHIGLELQLEKLLAFHDIVKIEKHVLLNVNSMDKLDITLYEMLRELLF